MNTAINIENISKSFPGVLANDSVSFDITSGTIHAIVGENGAGKSTLMKILYGMQKPDNGILKINGDIAKFQSPKDAIASGIGMVHQHFMLADNLTVWENIVLGIDSSNLSKIKRSKYIPEISDLSKKYSLPIDVNLTIDDLGVGEKQRVEILKVLYRGANILILDEPTAVLVPQEVEELFENLKNLVSQGVTILFISHKLDEVMEIADRISVMRGGQHVGTVSKEEASKKILAEMMIGKDLPTPPSRDTLISSENCLQLKDLNGEPSLGKIPFEDINLEIKKGEICGIAGVEGNGQRELSEAILGLYPVESGQIFLEDIEITKLSTRERRLIGISFIPEDRQSQGLVVESNLIENIILGKQSSNTYSSKFKNVLFKNASKNSKDVVDNYDVKTPSVQTLALALSGGNQQKFVVGREIDGKPRFLLASQPTRGVDIGAQALIWDKLKEARDMGLGVLLISADLDELLGLSDKLYVIYEGKLVKQLDPKEATPEQLGSYMTGLGI